MARNRRHANKLVIPSTQEENQRNIGKMVNALRDRVPKEYLAYDANGATGVEHAGKRITQIRITQVCWAFPMDEVVFSPWVTNLLFLRPMPWDEILTIKHTYLPDARNKLHEQYVNEAHADWLFMLDSDVCPPPDTLDRLLLHHKRDPRRKMLGGWYRKKGEPYDPVVYEYAKRENDAMWWRNYSVDEIGEGLERVDGAGAGCWLMHREIAEALGPRPYNMNEGGEDLTLCKKVSNLGYDMYIDWSIAAAHTGVALA